MSSVHINACIAVALAGLILCSAAAAQPGSASVRAGSYLSTANTGGINSSRVTLEARIRPDGPGSGRTDAFPGAAIVVKPRQNLVGPFLESWGLYWEPATARVTLIVTHALGSTGSIVTSHTTVPVGQTAQIAGSFDGVTLRLYINGVLDASAAAVADNIDYVNGEPVLIGGANYGSGFTRRFEGLIDDVRVWSTTRSAGDVAADSPCQLTPGAHAGLLANWVFDDGSTADVSGNSRSASFVGPAAFGADLAACCAGNADFNSDGFVDFFDFADFVDCFEGVVCPPGRDADFNRDGFADFFDFDAYVAAFESGC